MAIAALICGVSAALATLVAGVRVRRPAWLSLPIQLTSLFVGELALFHAVAQLLAAGLLIRGDALDRPLGRAGIGLMGASIIGLLAIQRGTRRTPPVLAEALSPLVAQATITPVPVRRLIRPFHADRRGLTVTRDVPYGADKRQRLDVYRLDQPVSSPRPVLIYIHGGGWVSGDKKNQGLPLLCEAARRGYVAVAVNYRLAPRHKFPAWAHDVKSAVIWTRSHIAEYGGDPNWIATAGGSAGGHLAAVMATTANEPSLQPAAADVDTSIAACVPLYGAFDFTDRWAIRARTSMVGFLEKMVMSTKLDADRATWELISPSWRGDQHTPPFFVIHGAIDVLLYREEARAFVDHLRQHSAAPVLYAELPYTQHAFDLVNSVRAWSAVEAIIQFLDAVHAARAAAAARAND